MDFSTGALDPILQSDEVRTLVEGATDRALDACGDGYVSEVELTSKRWRGVVITGDYRAMRDNAKTNTLLRAVDNI